MMLNVAIQGAGNVSTEHIRAYMNNPHTRVGSHWQQNSGGCQEKGGANGPGLCRL